MKRRSFLRMLGLAPIVAASPSLALPKPDSPKDVVRGIGSTGEAGPEAIVPLREGVGTLYFDQLICRPGNCKFDMQAGQLRIYV